MFAPARSVFFGSDADDAWFGDDVSNYPTFGYSKKTIVKVGKVLGEKIIDDPARRDELVEIFRIAHSWRNSHAYPMRRIRQELSGKVRKTAGDGITAARLKRMSSIRKKLSRLTTTILQIQDIGGCRAICQDIAQVNAIVGLYRGGDCMHKLRTDRSYIENPKKGGYRSHHLVLEFQPSRDDEEPFRDRRIEVQIRTRLQHAWATAVEAVGLVRNEDMKAGEGDADWLRLFELMSSEFALAENYPLVPNTPQERSQRVEELRDLDAKINAVSTLEHLRNAFRDISGAYAKTSEYFLIQYDHVAMTVNVKGYSNPVRGGVGLLADESSGSGLTTVLVEVDKIENLKDAYPNYFLDVALFRRWLMKSVGKLSLDSYTSAPPLKGIDLSFVRDRGNWRPTRT